MDIAVLRIAVTVVAFVCFLAIVAWAWSGRRAPRFAEAALLPFDEGELEGDGGLPQGARAQEALK
jgi:cytochrome c oxidase cbb3-type subunit 4